MIDTPRTDKAAHHELTEAWHLLSVLSANLMDDGPSWPRVLEWLHRNESFRPANTPPPPPQCRHCAIPMKPGKSLVSTLTGEEDDIGGCVTLSAGGPGRMVAVMKCPSCGHSFIPPSIKS